MLKSFLIRVYHQVIQVLKECLLAVTCKIEHTDKLLLQQEVDAWLHWTVSDG
jgi:hypothetical protein